MDQEKDFFKKRLQINHEDEIKNNEDSLNSSNNHQKPLVVMIDDSADLVNDLKEQLPDVDFESMDIDRIVRDISWRREDPILEKADLIFIDTFYRDEQTKSYAIDFFEMYMNMSEKARNDIKGKYKVLIGIDDINEALIKKKGMDISMIKEKTRIASLSGKVRKHPNLKWGIDEGSKTEIIIKEIQQLIQNDNKFQSHSNEKNFIMEVSNWSLLQWTQYIKTLISRIEKFVGSIEKQKVSDSQTERLNSIILQFKSEIDRVNKILESDGSDDNKKIKSIPDALECTKCLYNNIKKQTEEVMRLLIDENNTQIYTITHDFNNSINSVPYIIFMTENNLAKKVGLDNQL